MHSGAGRTPKRRLGCISSPRRHVLQPRRCSTSCTLKSVSKQSLERAHPTCQRRLTSCTSAMNGTTSSSHGSPHQSTGCWIGGRRPSPVVREYRKDGTRAREGRRWTKSTSSPQGGFRKSARYKSAHGRRETCGPIPTRPANTGMCAGLFGRSPKRHLRGSSLAFEGLVPRHQSPAAARYDVAHANVGWEQDIVNERMWIIQYCCY